MKCQRRTDTSFGNPHVARRELSKQQHAHKERLNQVKSTLDTRPPAAQPHLTLCGRDYVAKKKQMTEAAFSDLKMIQSIARTMTRKQDSMERRGPVSLNADFKKQEVYRIMHDNHQLLDSIEQVSPVIRSKDAIRDHRNRQRYVINSSHTMRMSGEYDADIQRIRNEDRAQFEATQRSTRSRMDAHRMRNSAGSVSLPSLTATVRSDPGLRRVPSQTSHAARQRRATSSTFVSRPGGLASHGAASSSTGRANASSAGIATAATSGGDAIAAAPVDHGIIYESDGTEHEAQKPHSDHVDDPVAVAAEPSTHFTNTMSNSRSDAATNAAVAADPSTHTANQSSSSRSDSYTNRNAGAKAERKAEPSEHSDEAPLQAREAAATRIAAAARGSAARRQTRELEKARKAAEPAAAEEAAATRISAAARGRAARRQTREIKEAGTVGREPDMLASPQLPEDSFESYEAPSEAQLTAAEQAAKHQTEASYSWESEEKDENGESGKDDSESEEKKNDTQVNGKNDDTEESYEDEMRYEESYEDEEDEEEADDSVMSPGKAIGVGGASPQAHEPSVRFGEIEDESATFETSGGG